MDILCASIFKSFPASYSGWSMKSNEKAKKNEASKEDDVSHNIGDYLPQLRMEKKEVTDETATHEGRIRLLRRLLRKRWVPEFLLIFWNSINERKFQCYAISQEKYART